MRVRKVEVLIFLLFVGVSVSAQQAASDQQQSASVQGPATPPRWIPHVVRDPDALKAVQASIAALGGAEAIGLVKSCIVQGHLEAAANGPARSADMVWEIAGSESKTSATSGGAIDALVSGNGKPFRLLNGAVKQVPPHILRAQFNPALVSLTLLKEFQDPNYSAQYLGSSTLGKANVEIVRLSSQASAIDTQVTPQTWYFDTTTNLPLRVVYTLPSNPPPDNQPTDSRSPNNHPRIRVIPAFADLSVYRSIAGVMYPFQSVVTIADSPYGTVTVSYVGPNANIPSTEFAPPAGGVE